MCCARSRWPPTPISAQRILDAAEAAGRTLMVCYNHRYRPEIVWLKEQITHGDFGEIYAAKAGWMREGWIPTHGAWFTQKERSGGGVLIDLGVHVLDLALWLLGYPKPVSVSGAAFAKFGPRQQKTKPRDIKPSAFDVDDSGFGFVRFKPTISISSPTLTLPRSIRPVTTVPRPEMENTSSIGIRNGRLIGARAAGCNRPAPAPA